jgi:Protein of unknown function (DUF3180)
MTPTRARWLVTLGVASAVLVWLLLRSVYADLAPLPWTPVPTLLLLAIVEAWAGRGLRARLAGRNRAGQDRDRAARLRPLPPIAIARTAALAKASAHAAAVIAGLAAGFVIYLAGSLGKTIPRGDVFSAAGTFIGAMALVAGALYLERSCRVPKDPDEQGTTRGG